MKKNKIYKYGLLLENSGNILNKTYSGEKFLGLFFLKKGWNKIEFWGEGDAKIYLKSKTLKNIYEGNINSSQEIHLNKNKVAYAYIFSASNSKIEKLEVTLETKNTLIENFSKHSNLIITHNANNEFWDFIQDSKNKNISFDILNIKQNIYSRITQNKGERVYEGNYSDLRELLMIHSYQNILFWDYNYDCLKAIVKTDFHKTTIYFKKFIDKNIYFNYEIYQRIYHCVPPKMSSAKIDESINLKNLYDNLNFSPNCIFVFENEKEKNYLESKLNLKFNQYIYQPRAFSIKTKNITHKYNNSKIKKIAILKEFDEYSRNAIDIDKKIIEQLSKQEYFDNIEIDFFGQGKWSNILLKNLLEFKNVHYHNVTLDNEMIEKQMEKYDLVINSNRDYINESNLYNLLSLGVPVITNNSDLYDLAIPKELIVDNNNINDYLHIIDKLLVDKKFYNYILNEVKVKIKNLNDNNNTLIDNMNVKKFYNLESVNNDEPILSVIIPAYNVSKYISATIWSLLNQKNYRNIEILVINDGSKDNTLMVVESLKQDLFESNTTILKIIDKENGGHGSVINCGLKEVKGKYVKLIDGDDTVNSYNFGLLIDQLINEKADVIINDYKEDYIQTNEEIPIKFYENVPINKLMDFEVLCKDKVLTYWGPLLPTATYNVSNLKKRPFKITEKIYYDDMEWNFNSIVNVNTLKYYDLNIYNHFIGREGQSVTMDGLIKNYKMHRIMTINLIKLYKSNLKIGKYKKKFLYDNYVLKMIRTHYMITMDYFRSPKPFREFDKELKKYPEFYNNKKIVTKKIKIYRKTNGNIKHFEFLLPFYRKIIRIIRR